MLLIAITASMLTEDPAKQPKPNYPEGGRTCPELDCWVGRASAYPQGILARFALALLVTYAMPAAAETITGRASVVDGDTLEIRSTMAAIAARVDGGLLGARCDKSSTLFRDWKVACLSSPESKS